MTYFEKRVRVADFRSLPKDSPLLVGVPGTYGKTRKLHWIAAAALERMSVAVKRDLDIELLAASGWRARRWASRSEYEAAMIRQYGSVREGQKWKAYASPHETGLAVDFGSGGLEPVSRTASKQRATKLHQWLVDHAHVYGWHPYKREPWHWEHWITAEAFERLPGVQRMPDREGWWWFERGGEWSLVCIHDPTGDGLEVHLRGPVSDFAVDAWGDRVPWPWESIGT